MGDANSKTRGYKAIDAINPRKDRTVMFSGKFPQIYRSWVAPCMSGSSYFVLEQHPFPYRFLMFLFHYHVCVQAGGAMRYHPGEAPNHMVLIVATSSLLPGSKMINHIKCNRPILIHKNKWHDRFKVGVKRKISKNLMRCSHSSSSTYDTHESCGVRPTKTKQTICFHS